MNEKRIKKVEKQIQRDGLTLGKVFETIPGAFVFATHAEQMFSASDLRAIADFLEVPSRKEKPTTWQCSNCGEKQASNWCAFCAKKKPDAVEQLAGQTEWMGGFESCMASLHGGADGHAIASKIMQDTMRSMEAESKEKVQRVLAAHAETEKYVGSLVAGHNRFQAGWNVMIVRLLATLSRDMRRLADSLENQKAE